MSPKMPMLKAKDIIRILKRLEFFEARTSGSHIFLKHIDGRATVVPRHSGEDIGKGLLRQILRDVNISPEDFMNLL